MHGDKRNMAYHCLLPIQYLACTKTLKNFKLTAQLKHDWLLQSVTGNDEIGGKELPF
jgi:hypothetical protein